MLGRLIKWTIKMLAIVAVGTLIGEAIKIIITEIPLWGLVAGFMLISAVTFKIAVWAIKGGDYG